MKWFGKKKETAPACCCQAAQPAVPQTADTGASVKVLGSGCAKCNALEQAARTALAELGMDTAVDHVTDFAQIAAWGVMTTPALVVDGKVICAGQVPDVARLKALIQAERSGQ